ncbi:GNAT family N-acetyltransferase [Geomonas sp. RF6]|uniref:GNAT family N-acetyltransferase n=1 Tax=Geomonas sp. RF6 TaxID=2897342 RepID=UPI001E657C52|nr:GNAT family N-acetyltransferase [Geomonas sp. RF6]UFS71096.1 GNAT family N-acetyltransferase [Geomonas sp. RF6]
MPIPKDTISRTFYALRSLGPSAFCSVLLSMLFSVNHYYLMGKNIAPPEEETPATPPVPLAKMTAEDLAVLQESVQSLGPVDRREVLARLLFYEDGFENCYVIKKGGEIVYLQWVIFPTENRTIEKHYAGKFYPLSDRQVMVENAFTFPRHRGKGHLLHGTQHLLQLARERGYSSAICYIRKDRIASLNEFARMGFRIVKMLTEYKVLGRAWRTL